MMRSYQIEKHMIKVKDRKEENMNDLSINWWSTTATYYLLTMNGDHNISNDKDNRFLIR